MRDVIYLLVMIGFFAVAAGLVGLCERVIGHDEPTTTTPSVTVGAPGDAAGVGTPVGAPVGAGPIVDGVVR